VSQRQRNDDRRIDAAARAASLHVAGLRDEAFRLTMIRAMEINEALGEGELKAREQRVA